ncbi:MAG TPA: hypothetical protein VHB50_10560, partial [Bryobacteraceae bacterium]|nr:hypothetical protein [Bryobacteraceae bacterium]
AILATAAGWLAYSHVAVTDIPMAACFSVAVLFAVSSGEKERSSEYVLASGALALAVLGKSLVPLVLFAPVVAVDYRRLREWLRPAPVAAFLVIALPWHSLCAMRNGAELWNVLFVQQQFGRFFSPERQHVQPWWFYLPVLLLLLFPWFPLLAVVDRDWRDRRTRLLGAVVIFGFLFFSKSVNKLPGYLLPLLPSVCILIGRGLARTKRVGLAMILPAALLGAIPVAAHILPYALATGLRSRSFPWSELAVWTGGAAVAATALALLLKQRSFPVVAAAAAALCIALQFAAFPAIDRAVSARSLWRERHPSCVPSADRALQYGLNYYAGRELPECAVLDQSRLKVVR